LLVLVVIVPWAQRPVAEIQLTGNLRASIDKLSFGTRHEIGESTPIRDRLQQWLPRRVDHALRSRHPHAIVTSESDSLVIWVTIRDVEFRSSGKFPSLGIVGTNETNWEPTQTHWFPFPNKVYRMAYVFGRYPRGDEHFELIIAEREPADVRRVTVANPFPQLVIDPVKVSLPARKEVGEFSIILTRLNRRTDITKTGPYAKYQYWEPEARLLWRGNLVAGWEPVTWQAFDSQGNWGDQLGMDLESLRYRVVFYPKAVNTNATAVLWTAPSEIVGRIGSNSVWDAEYEHRGELIKLIGQFGPGMNVFARGQYASNFVNAPMPNSRGKTQWNWVQADGLDRHGHVTDRPTIYLHVASEEFGRNIGLRVRDPAGRIWPTTREPLGPRGGVIPFMLDVPAGVTNVVPEIVLLNPVAAEFTVRTPVGLTP